MPYYHAIIEGPIRVKGERETEVGVVYDRPLSFRAPHVFKDGHLFFKREMFAFDVLSHDRGVIVALRDGVSLVLKHHEVDPDGEKIIDVNPKLALKSQSEINIEEIKLSKGDRWPVYRTSFCTKEKPNEQVRWSYDMESCGEDFFEDLCLAAIKGVLKNS